MKRIKSAVSDPSEYRLWYNDWVAKNANGMVLDVGKSQYWEYGFDTLDSNPKLNPTYVDDICHSKLESASYDTVLCNGMYEVVEDPQKMIDECLRIARNTVIFGFVGEYYRPYRKQWKYYNDDETIPYTERVDFSKNYHFLICHKQ